MYNLTVNLDTFPKGEPINVDGLGIFYNGEPGTVSEIEAQIYEMNNKRTMENAFSDSTRFVLKKMTKAELAAFNAKNEPQEATQSDSNTDAPVAPVGNGGE